MEQINDDKMNFLQEKNDSENSLDFHGNHCTHSPFYKSFFKYIFLRTQFVSQTNYIMYILLYEL